MKKLAFLPIVLTLLLSCSSDDNGNVEEVFEPFEVTFATVAKGELFGTEGIVEQDIVINSPMDWSELLDAMTPYDGYLFEIYEEDISFEEFQVLASFDGHRPYPGWAVEIVLITEFEEYIKVTVNFFMEYIGINPMINQPFHIVKIPKSDKPVVFERIYPED
jgi:hypothetical protein